MSRHAGVGCRRKRETDSVIDSEDDSDGTTEEEQKLSNPSP